VIDLSWKFDDSKPIYSQIAQRFKEQIASGELPPGGKVPTVREIAETAGVNPNTVQRALSELEVSALVDVLRGNGGRFVTNNAAILDKLRNDLANSATSEFLRNMKKIGIKKQEAIDYLTKFEGEE
jgi:DNA-binding transcriptional regulator YhcF (GntR family)